MNELGCGFVGQESGDQVAQSDAKTETLFLRLLARGGKKGLSFVKREEDVSEKEILLTERMGRLRSGLREWSKKRSRK